MRSKLFAFQKEALGDLRKQIIRANNMLADGDDQVIISFSAPTGSGKTIVMTALFEDILFGTADMMGDPNAIIIWLSDMPELNAQSRRKIELKSDKINERNIQTIDSTFDRETLECGKIYFLNTQKLGNDKLLTHKSDARAHTIWETLSNTAQTYKGHVYLVIDEAHRGSTKASGDDKVAASIMQKFILGSITDGLCPMPLVVGVTATPQRFNNLVSSTNSTTLKVLIRPEDVRSSGLLKDRVIIHYPETSINANMAMFQSAVTNWMRKSEQWKKYCEEEQEDRIVRPVLVIQVEDGNSKSVTSTEIESYLMALETKLGRSLMDGEVVHCMDTKKPLSVGGWFIPYMEASRIEENMQVNFVLFKMSLSTGWDCPRAEVMMSFRSAQDHTYIAQLLGRMVRTPLARRIASNDELNEVCLFLPHYNEKTVQEVVNTLISSEDTALPEIVVNRAPVECRRDPQYQDVFADMEGKLVTYSLENSHKIAPLRRLMQFCRYLKIDNIDPVIHGEVQQDVINLMITELDQLKSAGQYDTAAQAITHFDVKSVVFDYGDNAYHTDDSGSEQVSLAEFDLDRHLRVAGKRLADGLEYAYRSYRIDHGVDDYVAKIELIVLTNSNEILQNINEWSEEKFAELYARYRTKLGKLGDSRRRPYDRLSDASAVPHDIDWHFPDSITVIEDENSRIYDKHLFISAAGFFKTSLTGWEHDLISEELKNDAHAWLRNFDRKPWSLCIPYRSAGKILPMYPDFLIVRKTEEGYSYSILEPHDSSKADNRDKAIGLAEFAEKHHHKYDRIQLIRKMKGADNCEHLFRLDMTDHKVRNKVKAAADNAALNQIFESDAFTDDNAI